MESYPVTITQQQNKIEFQGVRATYPTGEPVTCYFTLPAQYKPETCDWVGIYPVGWSSLNHYLVKKQIRPENIWTTCPIVFPTTIVGTQYGQVEFDGELLPKSGEQYYQFVYVKNGEYIRGASTPFMFVPTCEQQQQQLFGGLLPEIQQQPRTLEQVFEREMQKLQNGIFGLEQGLFGYKTVFPLIEETQQQQQTTPLTGMWSLCGEMMPEHQQPINKKHWQQRIQEVQQLLVEQAKIEQSHHRLEQLNMIAQLKQYERHIAQCQRREQEIREFLKCKMQKQIEQFEQKVCQVMKLNGEQQQQQSAEQYIKKYEQLLKEKIELDIQKRQAVQHKLRQSIKECERQLRQLQQQEQQQQTRFHQILRQKLAQFETKYYPTSSVVVIEQELREQLRQLIAQFLLEQRKEQFQLVKAQKQLLCLCQEICTKLQDMELSECYTQLRIPRVPQYQQQYYYVNGEHQQTYTHIQQLEQQLNELKQTLRMKMYQQQQGKQQFLNGEYLFQQQQLNGEWIRQITQKLREMEWNLRQLHQQQQIVSLVEQQQQQPINGGMWFERRIQSLVQHLKYFEGKQQQQIFEESRLREIMCQLRELEAELNEYQPQQYQQYRQQLPKQIIDLVQQLQTILREKIAQFGQIFEQSPIVECFIQTGNHQSWKQMMQYERKLAQLKTYLWERQQYQQLHYRLVDLEQQLRQCQQQGQQQQQVFGGKQQQQRFVEQIRVLRQLLQEQQQQYQQQQYVLHPEYYIQHQQKFERLYQIVNDLELSFPIQYQQQQQFQTIAGQYQQQQVTMYLIQQRFEKLVHEFQRQVMPELTIVPVAQQQKIEQIISFLRQQQQIEKRSVYVYGQQLRQKVQEFEQIVAEQYEQQQEREQQQQWTVSVPQQQTTTTVLVVLKSILRQIRELKGQIQQQQQQQLTIGGVECQQQQNGEWVLVNGVEFEGQDINNNQSSLFGGLCGVEPVEVLAEVTLAELLRQPEQYQCEYQQQQTRFTGVQQQQQQWEQFERQMQQIEQLVCGQQQQQWFTPCQQQMRSSVSVENLIQDLESELVKLRLQKELPVQQQQQPVTQTTTTTRVVLTTPESVCDEISKFVGQNLLTTVVPTIVKVAQEQAGKQQQQTQQQQTTTVFVEPTPFGVKVQQQKETTTTQQQQQQLF